MHTLNQKGQAHCLNGTNITAYSSFIVYFYTIFVKNKFVKTHEIKIKTLSFIFYV